MGVGNGKAQQTMEEGNEFEKFLPEDGYTIVQPPEGYKPAIKSSLTAPSAEEDVGFGIQDSTTNLAHDV